MTTKTEKLENEITELCDECKVKEHDICPLVPDCRCCLDTIRRQEDDHDKDMEL